ncbi:MAG: sialate O-acetylesterase [Planctomycetota bacterium]
MSTRRRTWTLTALLALVCVVLAVPDARAEVDVADIFTEHAVLQADTTIPVWGTAAPGAEVRVSVAGTSAECTADEDGRWRAEIGSLEPGGPHELIVETDEDGRLSRSDVMIGEVWLASGQSNMVWPVRKTKTAEKAIEAGDRPHIRFFQVEHNPAGEPRPNPSGGSWVRSTPETVPGFSAAAYHFACALRERLSVPVGIIQSAVGGSRVQAWMGRGYFAGNPRLRPDLEQIEKLERKLDDLGDVENPRRTPTVYYNGMIAPLVPYAIRGAIWYQGEANARIGDEERYEAAFSALINGWRRDWGRNFPFLFVQLPEFRGRGERWIGIREQQRLTNEHVANTAMVVTLGLGNPGNIHPRRKQPVGRRLASAALARAYGRTDAAWSGPLVQSATALGGGKVTLDFGYVKRGLKARGGGLTGFEVQDQEGDWMEAEATISGNHVVVSSPVVPQPQAVRYGWSEVPEPSLVSGAGLPASPFKIDVSH